MLNGWLVYTTAETERNAFFIRQWHEAASERGICLRLILAEELSFGVRNNAPFLLYRGEEARPDFVVMRLQHPVLSHHLERMGVAVFNNAQLAEVCNDKQLTHLYLAGSVPMMNTAFIKTTADVFPPFRFPLVVKASHSCGGRKVFLCKDQTSYEQALMQCAPDTAVVQPLCDEPGKDVRVYLLGKKIICTMMRFSADGDFRSNLGQGGDACTYELDAKTKGYVEDIAARFQFGLVGVDFIFHQKRLVFNEIEDAVGTRMLYMHTKIDIVREYLSYILSNLIY